MLAEIFMVIYRILKTLLIVLIPVFLVSCETRPRPFDDTDIIFNGSPDNNGMGGLSFALFKDRRYRIMNSGETAAHYYSGTFKVSGDTIILENLNKESGLISNRLLIFRYADQDSSFWMWKHEKKIGFWKWRYFKLQDSKMGKGNVFQLDENGNPTKEESYFRITIDDLKNFR
jgi:hypothetical protein